MSEEEHIAQFMKDGPIRNQEIFDNLKALRGEHYAELVSELANIRLYMTALKPCSCFPGISDMIMHTGITLSYTFCKMHQWNVTQMLADIDMMFNARALKR